MCSSRLPQHHVACCRSSCRHFLTFFLCKIQTLSLSLPLGSQTNKARAKSPREGCEPGMFLCAQTKLKHVYCGSPQPASRTDLSNKRVIWHQNNNNGISLKAFWVFGHRSGWNLNECIDTERSRRFDVMHCVDGLLLYSTYAISKEGAPTTSLLNLGYLFREAKGPCSLA